MARKTHRPDDILWTVTAADIDAVLSQKYAKQNLSNNGRAVSYTHLDVYKRQVQWGPVNRVRTER